jgi:DnaJ-domain-containing protein 1
MIWLLAGIGVLVGVLLLMRGFVATPAAQLAQGLRWAGIGLGALLVLFLLLTGRMGAALAVGAGLLPLLMRWRQRRAPAAEPGQSSEVETPWLRMRLDHDTGHMEGTVRQGAFRGRRLDELGREEVLALWREVRGEDEGSASLLETWLDRAWPDWHGGGEKAERADAPRAGRLTPAEALEILELSPGASADEIRAAHRRLMLKVHPDHGGSTWLAARINEARDVLLGEA